MKQPHILLLRITLATALTIATHFAVFVVCWRFSDQLGTAVTYAARQLTFASGAVAPEMRTFDDMNAALSASLLFSSPLIVSYWASLVFSSLRRHHQVAIALSCLVLGACGAGIAYASLPFLPGVIELGRAAGLRTDEHVYDLTLYAMVGSGIVFQLPAFLIALRLEGPSAP